MRVGLQLKAALENVTDLRPEGDDFRWFLKLRCANCGEVTSKWVYAIVVEKVPLKGSRGSANIVAKCKLCARENSLDIVEDSMAPYTAQDSGQFKTVVTFECRGLEPVDFDPRSGFCARGEDTHTLFNDVDLSDREWTDYDEKAQKPVSILEVEHQFVKQ